MCFYAVNGTQKWRFYAPLFHTIGKMAKGIHKICASFLKPYDRFVRNTPKYKITFYNKNEKKNAVMYMFVYKIAFVFFGRN